MFKLKYVVYESILSRCRMNAIACRRHLVTYPEQMSHECDRLVATSCFCLDFVLRDICSEACSTCMGGQYTTGTAASVLRVHRRSVHYRNCRDLNSGGQYTTGTAAI